MQTNMRDPGLDTLLYLDGETLVVDSGGKCWDKFEVRQCTVTAERPQGLRYSLTLHDEAGSRLLGFDNAHRGAQVRFYFYEDAAKLLADFWVEVEAILARRSSQHEYSQRLEGRDCVIGAIQSSDDGNRPR